MELQNSPFLRVLRAGLWNLPLEDSGSMPLSETDWTEILSLARAHSVQALIADGTGLVPEASKPSLQQIASLAISTDAVEKGNSKVESVLKQMSACWKSNGVEAVLLKGQGLAGMYAIPQHRTPGDIDWYFPGKENYSKALSIVQSRGFIPEYDSDGDCHYIVNGVVVEHHRRWCDLSSPLKEKCVASVEKEFGYSQGQDYNTLAPLTNLVQLNCHILKHLLVMGIGWRQLCDLAIASRHYVGLYSQEEYRLVISDLGLTKWTKLLYGVLAKYLGVDSSSLPVEPLEVKDVDQMAGYIMGCGNFGKESGKGMLTSYMTSVKLLSRYTFVEVFWRPFMLAWNRFGRCF